VGKAKRLRAQRRAAPPPVGKNRPPRRAILIWGGIVAALAVAGIAVAVIRSSSGGYESPKPVEESALSGLQTGPLPWRPEIASLAGRLRILQLPALSQEGTVVHIHQHLDVFVDGRHAVVPGGIGIDDSSFISPIHTHDPSGVIHVESPSKEHFTLAQFFAIWGVRFTTNALGGYRASSARPIRFYVDGKPLSSDARGLVLASHQEIAVVVGRAPARIPSSYSFPEGD
jgi:hypothetical protein